jgi:hypothetical protein
MALIFDWLLLYVIDDEDRHGSLLRFQLQSELPFDRLEKRDGAVWIRCRHGRAARRRLTWRVAWR